jgi:hypothetical protein
MAKKAVDSTLRRILNYTAEIMISIILLVTICIPLAFTIPMWFQHVLFDVPRTELAINPANWWGLDGTLWVTLLLALVSLGLGYLYIIKLNPGGAVVAKEEVEDVDEEEDDIEVDDVSTEDVSEDIAEDVPLEDQEEEIPLEDQEEDEPDLDEIESTLEEESEEE